MVAMPTSKIKAEIARILKEEGFIEGFEVVDGEKAVQKVLRVQLKYVGERRERHPVITGLERVSRPGRRVYTQKQDIPWVLSGIGIAILSTPKGVMTGQSRASAGRWRRDPLQGLVIQLDRRIVQCLELDDYR